MRRRAKVDTNQPEIVALFRKLGWSVAHTHTIGDGFPDLCISRAGTQILIEVKDGSLPPSKRKLTQDELSFHESWQGRIEIIESIEDVIDLHFSIFIKGETHAPV